MNDTVVPYELPEENDHSFFFIHQHIPPALEAKLHSHDAWELYCVTRGRGLRTVGDTVLPFSEGEVVLLPPGIIHRWKFEKDSAEKDGNVSYLMVAFRHSFISRLVGSFPELRNRISLIEYLAEAIKFSHASSGMIRSALEDMEAGSELDRLSLMLKLLPLIFTRSDYTFVGKPMALERNVRRIQKICEYVSCP